MSHPPHTPTEAQNRRRKIILTICLAGAFLLSVSAAMYRLSKGVDVQNGLVRVMFAHVDNYLKAHQGAWPSSWRVLKEFPSEGNWYDPINYDLAQQNVIIDFEPDLNQISAQTPPEFTAIRPVNPVFDFGKDPRLVALLETIRQYHGPAKSE